MGIHVFTLIIHAQYLVTVGKVMRDGSCGDVKAATVIRPLKRQSVLEPFHAAGGPRVDDP